jgi:F-type H+-transporting ATPase subunit delta
LAENSLQAKRFSQAVFEIALEHQEIEKWQSDLQQMAILAQNEEVVAVMENPRFSFKNKSGLLDKQLKGISQKASNLAYILTTNGNFSLITQVYAGFQELLDKHRGIEKAEVVTAIPLDENERIKLAERLGEITGKKIILTEKVDPGIIGGIIARVGGSIIDGSTRSRLAALKSELANAGH